MLSSIESGDKGWHRAIATSKQLHSATVDSVDSASPCPGAGPGASPCPCEAACWEGFGWDEYLWGGVSVEALETGETCTGRERDSGSGTDTRTPSDLVVSR